MALAFMGVHGVDAPVWFRRAPATNRTGGRKRERRADPARPGATPGETPGATRKPHARGDTTGPAMEATAAALPRGRELGSMSVEDYKMILNTYPFADQRAKAAFGRRRAQEVRKAKDPEKAKQRATAKQRRRRKRQRDAAGSSNESSSESDLEDETLELDAMLPTIDEEGHPGSDPAGGPAASLDAPAGGQGGSHDAPADGQGGSLDASAGGRRTKPKRVPPPWMGLVDGVDAHSRAPGPPRWRLRACQRAAGGATGPCRPAAGHHPAGRRARRRHDACCPQRGWHERHGGPAADARAWRAGGGDGPGVAGHAAFSRRLLLSRLARLRRRRLRLPLHRRFRTQLSVRPQRGALCQRSVPSTASLRDALFGWPRPPRPLAAPLPRPVAAST